MNSFQEQTAAQTLRKIDAHDLRNYLEQFQSDNMRSADVEHRWLAAYAGDLKTMAYHVKTGNHDTIRKQVNEFRLHEIDEAKNELEDESDKLKNEEIKLLRETEQIPPEMEQ